MAGLGCAGKRATQARKSNGRLCIPLFSYSLGKSAEAVAATLKPRHNLLMSEIPVPRRAFLRGATAMTALSYSRVFGANYRLQVGLVGAGERGRYDTGNFVKTGKADVAAVCDIYGNNIDQAKSQWPSAKSFTDHRKLLETKELDVAV